MIGPTGCLAGIGQEYFIGADSSPDSPLFLHEYPARGALPADNAASPPLHSPPKEGCIKSMTLDIE